MPNFFFFFLLFSFFFLKKIENPLQFCVSENKYSCRSFVKARWPTVNFWREPGRGGYFAGTGAEERSVLKTQESSWMESCNA